MVLLVQIQTCLDLWVTDLEMAFHPQRLVLLGSGSKKPSRLAAKNRARSRSPNGERDSKRSTSVPLSLGWYQGSKPVRSTSDVGVAQALAEHLPRRPSNLSKVEPEPAELPVIPAELQREADGPEWAEEGVSLSFWGPQKRNRSSQE